MSRLYCVNLITNHYDWVIRSIDIYTEHFLETIDPNDLMTEMKSEDWKFDNNDAVLSGYEKYLTPVEPNYTPGVTRAVDYINSIRQEMIDRVTKCQQDTLDFYHENRKEFDFDPKEMDEVKENDLKRRLFAKTFCFLTDVFQFFNEYDSINFHNTCLFKLYLVVCDHYIYQDGIDYVRYHFDLVRRDDNEQKPHDITYTDSEILVLSSLVTYIGDCSIYSRGNQHVIEIKLEHLLASNGIKLRLRVKENLNYTIEFSSSSMHDFSNLTDLKIVPTHYCKTWFQYKLKSLGFFPNLTKLYLTSVFIENESAFENLLNLRHLTLFCLTLSCEFDIHKQMPNLQVLRLYQIDFEGQGKLIGFSKLEYLEKMELYYGYDKKIDLYPNPNVTHLRVTRNRKWENLPLISLYPNLKHLCIDQCYKGGNIFLENYKSGLNLESLVLRRSLESSLSSKLALHTNLRCLEISKVYDVRMPLEAFNGLTQLEELSINDCLLTEDLLPSIIPALTVLPNLKKLSLKDNSFNQLPPDMFISNPKLTHLDLSGNELELKKGDLNNLSNLKNLCLRDNRMKKLEDGVFMGMNNLEELDLGGNQLDEESLCQLNELWWINLVVLEPHIRNL